MICAITPQSTKDTNLLRPPQSPNARARAITSQPLKVKSAGLVFTRWVARATGSGKEGETSCCLNNLKPLVASQNTLLVLPVAAELGAFESVFGPFSRDPRLRWYFRVMGVSLAVGLGTVARARRWDWVVCVVPRVDVDALRWGLGWVQL